MIQNHEQLIFSIINGTLRVLQKSSIVIENSTQIFWPKMSRWFIVKSVTTKILSQALYESSRTFLFVFVIRLFLQISAKALQIFLALFHLHPNNLKNRNLWFKFSTASLLPWGASDLFQKSHTYNKVFMLVVFHPGKSGLWTFPFVEKLEDDWRRNFTFPSVLRIRDPVPFWPLDLDQGSGIGFFRIPDPNPISIRA